MIKFKSGSVTNPETGVTKDIVIQAKSPVGIEGFLICGCLLVNGVIGVVGLMELAFLKGAHAAERAEIIALSEAGLLDCYNP